MQGWSVYYARESLSASFWWAKGPKLRISLTYAQTLTVSLIHFGSSSFVHNTSNEFVFGLYAPHQSQIEGIRRQSAEQIVDFVILAGVNPAPRQICFLLVLERGGGFLKAN